MSQENTSVVKYMAKDGIEIALDFNTVKNYLVKGKKELVTPQEVMFFLGTCKSKGLNPFKGDVHLVKYTEYEPAAIITSIDYYRSRAKAMKDQRGWKKGIIVLRNGKVVDTNGLLLKDDELLGGWAEAKPEGWEEPFRLEVNLAGFIKKKKDGTVTQFWTEEKQPAMIMKVAESQLLRTLWPDEFQGMYEEDEIPVPGEVIEVTAETISTPPTPQQTIDDLIKEVLANKNIPPGVDFSYLDQYIEALAKHNKKTVETVKIEATTAFDGFLKGFGLWCTRLKKAKQDAKDAEDKKKKEEQDKKRKDLADKRKAEADKKKQDQAKKDPPPPEPKKETPPPEKPKEQTISMIFCPDTNTQEEKSRCDACSLRDGCPAWDDVPF